jgi:ferredoxin
MADKNDKYADNAPGPFYVDRQCILCHLCSDIAPNHFKESEDGDHDFVHTQPTTDDAIALCLEAMEQCPVEAIGSDG